MPDTSVCVSPFSFSRIVSNILLFHIDNEFGAVF